MHTEPHPEPHPRPQPPPQPEPPQSAADPRLVRLLGGPETAWLVTRARRRLEHGGPLTGTVSHPAATEAEREAVARLLGRRPRPGSTLTVRWDAVDEVLRRSGVHPAGLASAVAALGGPVRDRAVERAAREAAWAGAMAPLDVLAGTRAELTAWVAELRRTGLVRRLAPSPESAGPLVTELVTVLDQLPASGEPIGRFAERVLGNAHGLDDDRPLATLVFGAARALGGAGEGSGAAWRRRVWAAVGLLRDDLSSTVLALALPGDATSATGRALGVLGEAGQPAVLTLRQLALDRPSFPSLRGRPVFVCENPVVIALAADRLGRTSSPVICVGGQPGAAAMRLLAELADGGAQLRYHGDFDWGGIRIGNVLFRRLAMAPWRFDAGAYRAAARRGGRPLSGARVEARWDPSLAAVMAEAGQAVEEERVADDLLADLSAPPPRPPARRRVLPHRAP